MEVQKVISSVIWVSVATIEDIDEDGEPGIARHLPDPILQNLRELAAEDPRYQRLIETIVEEFLSRREDLDFGCQPSKRGPRSSTQRFAQETACRASVHM